MTPEDFRRLALALLLSAATIGAAAAQTNLRIGLDRKSVV